jgi:uncharacterized protein YqhQ
MNTRGRIRSFFWLQTAAHSRILVGGQAVIEGVMMRVPGSYAVAVRDPGGEIQTRREDFSSAAERSRWLGLPVVRGAVHLYEALKLGLSTLNWSMEIAYPEEAGKTGRAAQFFSTTAALLLAVVLFFAGPYWITTKLLDIEQRALAFNLISGLIRIAFFLLYLLLISQMKDIRRLFQYHGAEHKTVYTFEAGKALTVENTRNFPTQHPRCGTSFIFIVLIAAILTFAIIDSIVLVLLGKISLGIRLLVHLPLIPLVAGVSYELLKITSKYQHRAFFRWLSKPGLWLQYITTKGPDDDQVTVAIHSLKAAFGERLKEVEGKQYVAEAIA